MRKINQTEPADKINISELVRKINFIALVRKINIFVLRKEDVQFYFHLFPQIIFLNKLALFYWSAFPFYRFEKI